jgi:hypothetical protein
VQAAYIEEMHTNIKTVLPQIKTDLFNGRAVYNPVNSAQSKVVGINIGRVELKPKLQRIEKTEYSDVFMEKRWVKIHGWKDNFPISRMDTLSGAADLQADLMRVIPPAVKRVMNRRGLDALVGAANVGFDETAWTQKNLPASNFHTWDIASGVLFTDVLKEVVMGFDDDDVDTEEQEIFAIADGFTKKALMDDPTYVNWLNMGEHVLPKGSLKEFDGVVPVKYNKLPFRLDTDGSKIYQIPVWVKDAIIIAPWLEPVIEVAIDTSNDFIRALHVEVYADAVRAYEQGVRVIEFKRP